MNDNILYEALALGYILNERLSIDSKRRLIGQTRDTIANNAGPGLNDANMLWKKAGATDKRRSDFAAGRKKFVGMLHKAE